MAYRIPLGTVLWGTGFPDPAVRLSAQPFSIDEVSFLPVTAALQPLILESVLRARTLVRQWVPP
jgi:hypothetical protein